MKKYPFILCLLATALIKTNAQPEQRRIDSLKIDSMKAILSTLKGIALSDCLNEIVKKYTSFQGAGGMVQRIDSMFHFAQLAYDEANRIGYKRGLTVSLLNMARSKQYSMQKGQEEYVRPALKIAEEIKDDHLIGEAYYLLAAVENEADNYKKAIYYFQKTNDIQQETEVTSWLCMSYSNTGDYEKALPYCDKCLTLAQQNVKKDTSQWGHELVQWSYYDMAEIYKAAGDYETAMSYLFKSNHYAESINSGWKNYLDISEVYLRMKRYDSAFFYWNKWKKDWDTYAWGHKAYGNTVLAQIYLATNKADTVIPLLRDNIIEFRKKGKEFGNGIIRPLLFTGNAYAEMKDYPTALRYVTEAFAYAKENNARPLMIDIYESLSIIYHQAGRFDSAYHYLLKFTAIRDSIQNTQFLLRLFNYKREAETAQKEARIGFLNRDNQIKQEQLKQEATFRYFLIAGFVALVLAGLYLYRSINQKRKDERFLLIQKEHEWKMKELESQAKQADLQRQAAHLEMQALRAQMNPHFIFNCLASINRFILKNESKAASNYLTRFSRLIRMVLINSQRSMIALEEELEMLEIYLDMERLRFKDSFDFVISFKNVIDIETVLIPPLILQPICENALWHGLMHKDGQGHLNIELSLENSVLQCVITDDGIGREKAAELKSKSAEKDKSMGLQITAQRLALLNQNKNVQTFYTIEDIRDENNKTVGTKVILKIMHEDLKPVPA